jgi:hypothetical protein
MDVFKTFIDFLEKLEEHNLHYRLDKVRGECVLVEIAVPGERWEAEFFISGAVEVERFRSDGAIEGHNELEVLFRDFADRARKEKFP